MELTPEARAEKRAYHKQWREQNKDKVAEANRRYWERKANEAKGLKTNTTNTIKGGR